MPWNKPGLGAGLLTPPGVPMRAGSGDPRLARYVGESGYVIGMKTFGASAPPKELQRKYGFEPDRVVAVAKEQLGRTA